MGLLIIIIVILVFGGGVKQQSELIHGLSFSKNPTLLRLASNKRSLSRLSNITSVTRWLRGEL